MLKKICSTLFNLFFIFLIAVALPIGRAAAVDPIQPQVIYGNDNRHEINQIADADIQRLASATVGIINRNNLIQLSDTPLISIVARTYGPSLKLCASERFYEQPSAPTCTGFLVAPDLIATAGHCVNASTCEFKAILFHYELDKNNKYPFQLPPEDVAYCKEVILREETPNQDYALIRLNRPILHVQPLLLASRQALPGESLFTIGHPSGLPKKFTDQATVNKLADGYFKTNTDSYGGSSGSPVFNLQNEVLGILVRGEDDYISMPVDDGSDAVCKVSKVCHETDCQGEDATDISYIRNLLPKQNKIFTRL